jgi:prepilin peptidase CpaA
MWESFIIAFAITVAVGDLLWRKIPRQFTMAAFVAGLTFHAIYGGFLSALLASFVAAVIAIVFFRVGAIGGGDVKLIICLGAILGLRNWIVAMNVAVLCAGAIALLQVARRRRIIQTGKNIVELLRAFKAHGLRPHPQINVHNPLSIRAPFAVAAALGTIFAVVRG